MKCLKGMKQIYLAIVLTVTTPFLAKHAYAQGRGASAPGGSGGGKSIRCTVAPGFPGAGYYALDYAIAMKTDKSEWFVTNNDPREHLRAIQNVFQGKLSSHFDRPGFSEFINKFDAVWRETIFKLEPTKDTPKSGPSSNCSVQTIQQITTKIDHLYFTNPAKAEELRQTGVVQWSAHLVHEMLRSYFSSSDDIAKWNRVLHSRSFFELEKAPLIEDLDRKGLFASKEIKLAHYTNLLGSMTDEERIAYIFERLNNARNISVISIPKKIFEFSYEQRVLKLGSPDYCALLKYQKESVVNEALSHAEDLTALRTAFAPYITKLSIEYLDSELGKVETRFLGVGASNRLQDATQDISGKCR